MATITQRGNRFQVKVRTSGKTRSHTCDTYEEAEAWGRNEEAAIAAGSPEANDAAARMTLAQLAQLYYEFQEAPDNVEDAIVAIKLAPFAELYMSELTPAHIQAWRPERDDVTRTLSDLIDWGKAELGIWYVENPAKAAYYRPEIKRVRRLTAAEESAILQATSGSSYLYDVVVLAVETAAKQGELLNLKWSDVRFSVPDIVITGRKGTRTTPISKAALSVLVRRKESAITDHVFPDLKENTLQQAFLRLTKSLDIKDLKFNDLRHEAIFRMKAKYSFEQIKRMTGLDHRSLGRYFEG